MLHRRCYSYAINSRNIVAKSWASFCLARVYSTTKPSSDVLDIKIADKQNDAESNSNTETKQESTDSDLINLSPLQKMKKLKLAVPKSNKMPPRPSIPETDISEKFIKGGSGKGGQKINKTNSKVQLTHLPTGLVVTSQATRSRDQNRKIAREILAMKIQEMDLGVLSRAQILIAKKEQIKQRSKRKAKNKYKKLDELKKEHQGKNELEEEEDECIVIMDDEVIPDKSSK